MQERNLFLLFIEPLNKLDIPYMVTGAVAAIIYGEPRMTHDLDVVLQLEAENISPFIQAYPRNLFYCPPEEIIQIENKRDCQGHFNLIHHATGFKADIYLMGRDPLHVWAMNQRKSYPLEGQEIWVAPPEYVIIRKLQFYKEGSSEKHINDIQSIIQTSGNIINRHILEEKIVKMNLGEVWESIKDKSALG